MKKRILTGITTTGKITIGNYIGSIKQILDLQKDENNEIIFFAANLHAITLPTKKEELKQNIKESIALYYALGLDFKKNIIYLQSDVLENTQLSYILLCNTTIGELTRMTQFKDKAAKTKKANNTSFIPTGILTYPTLMAADILLYNGNIIPVGKDQKQHIELTRNIAIRMNNKYGNIFKIPQELFVKNGIKIKNLQNPNKKMSKSDNNKNTYISLLDNPKEVKNKINKAVTDSENKIYFNEKTKPGISNLLNIYCCLKNININDAEKIFKNKNYKEFKEAIIFEINKLLKPIQKKYNKIINNKEKIENLLKKGAKKAKNIASLNLNNIKNKMGINY